MFTIGVSCQNILYLCVVLQKTFVNQIFLFYLLNEVESMFSSSLCLLVRCYVFGFLLPPTVDQQNSMKSTTGCESQQNLTPYNIATGAFKFLFANSVFQC